MADAETSGGGIKIDPMSQFQVQPLFGDSISVFTISNVTLWMALAEPMPTRHPQNTILCGWLLTFVHQNL